MQPIPQKHPCHNSLNSNKLYTPEKNGQQCISPSTNTRVCVSQIDPSTTWRPEKTSLPLSPYATLLKSKLPTQPDTSPQDSSVIPSLTALSARAIVSCERVIAHYNQNFDSFELPPVVINKCLKRLFSPENCAGEWTSQRQLAALKELRATVSGIPLNQFDSVKIINLSDIKPRRAQRVFEQKSFQLNIVYGQYTTSSDRPTIFSSYLL